jgi:hypothetical protein
MVSERAGHREESVIVDHTGRQQEALYRYRDGAGGNKQTRDEAHAATTGFSSAIKALPLTQRLVHHHRMRCICVHLLFGGKWLSEGSGDVRRGDARVGQAVRILLLEADLVDGGHQRESGTNVPTTKSAMSCLGGR